MKTRTVLRVEEARYRIQRHIMFTYWRNERGTDRWKIAMRDLDKTRKFLAKLRRACGWPPGLVPAALPYYF